MLTLATVADVKDKLDVPASDKSMDGAIQKVLDAVSAYVQAETGLEYAATVGRVDVLRDVPRDGVVVTRYRPVASLTSVTVRDLGSTVETSVTGDLVDAAKGEVALVPDLAGWGYPNYESTPHSSRYRLREWHVLKLTYTTSAVTKSTHPDLADAEAAMAALWFRDQRGMAESVSASGVTESLLNLAVHPTVWPTMARHKRRPCRWV